MTCSPCSWTTTAIAIQHPQPDEPLGVATVDGEGYTDHYGNDLLHMEACISCGTLRLPPNDPRVKCLVLPHAKHEEGELDPTKE